MARPLFITGIGAVTPLGDDWAKTWQGLLSGRPAVTKPSELKFALPSPAPACAIPGFDRSVRASGSGPAAFLIHSAASQIGPGTFKDHRIWAATNHGEADLEIEPDLTHQDPKQALRSLTFGGGKVSWLASACTGGLHALWLAWLESGTHAGPWLVVAGDALSVIGVAGFFSAGATGDGRPQPFREGSGGMLVGEGAVALELRADKCTDQSALLAVASSCDAGHPTHPDPSGLWLEQAICDALKKSGCAATDIGVIVAHGTGTRANDEVEAMVLDRLFASGSTLVTSVKGTIGHMMGAAGVLNVAIAAEIWRTGQVPPSAGSGTPKISLRLAGLGDRVAPRRPVLALASGFGGNNVAAVIG